MSKRLLPLTVLLIVAPAVAQAQPNSREMSCAAVAELVQRDGFAVITTGPGVFDRYVKDTGFCAGDQITVPAWVPTSDQPQCPVGYRCTVDPSHSK